MNALIAEAVGTFVFVLAILFIVFRDKDAIPSYFQPVLIAMGLLVAIYICSGMGGSAHLNPAVSAVMGLNGSISSADAVSHVLAQLVGAGSAYMLFKTVQQLA